MSGPTRSRGFNPSDGDRFGRPEGQSLAGDTGRGQANRRDGHGARRDGDDRAIVHAAGDVLDTDDRAITGSSVARANANLDAGCRASATR
jgi:hypothetical protein